MGVFGNGNNEGIMTINGDLMVISWLFIYGLLQWVNNGE